MCVWLVVDLVPVFPWGCDEKDLLLLAGCSLSNRRSTRLLDIAEEVVYRVLTRYNNAKALRKAVLIYYPHIDPLQVLA